MTKEKVIELIKTMRIMNYQYKKRLVKYIEIYMEQHYFRFKNRFHIQTKGLPMGSLLSLFMAEININNFEKKVLKNARSKMKIKNG